LHSSTAPVEQHAYAADGSTAFLSYPVLDTLRKKKYSPRPFTRKEEALGRGGGG